jgi:hypothetical protein
VCACLFVSDSSEGACGISSSSPLETLVTDKAKTSRADEDTGEDPDEDEDDDEDEDEDVTNARDLDGWTGGVTAAALR